MAWAFLILALQDDQEQKLYRMIDGYVLPTFDAKPFREALKAAAHAKLMGNLFLYVDQEAQNLEAKLYAMQLDLPPVKDRPSEADKRQSDIVQKKMKILEKQLLRLDEVRGEMIQSLHMVDSNEATRILLTHGPKIKRQESRLLFADILSRQADAKDVVAISHLFCVEKEFVLLERYVPAFSKIQTATEPAIRKLCGMAQDVRHPRSFRRSCVKSLGQIGSPMALDALVNMMNLDSVASNVEDAVLKIIGGLGPRVCGRMP